MTDVLDSVSYSGPPRHASGAPLKGGSSRERKARRRRRRVRTFVVLLVALAVVAGAGAYVVKNDGVVLGFVTPLAPKDFPGPGQGEYLYTVQEGATGWSMAQDLYDAGVVGSVKAFVREFDANPDSAGIQVGEHALLLQMSAADAVARLAANEINRGGLTVIEGYTVAQIKDSMIAAGWPQPDVEAALADPGALGLPAEAGGNLEGWLAASTYDAKPDTTPAADALREMVAYTVAELDELGVAPDQRHDVIIKASIVEREAPDAFRGEVARVIENRLASSEVLGMDAIESYYAGKPAHEMTSAELNDTTSRPFNSRRMDGLPPTAIGAPSRASVEAVLNPPDGPWIYYVTVNLDTQETKFTADVGEFEQFKAEYKAWAAANGY